MNMHRKRWWALAALSIACAGGDDANEAEPRNEPAASAPTPAPAAPAAPQMGDAEIAHVAVTANTIDSEAGQQALSKASNAEVKQFAQTMINDHNGVNKEAAALAQRLGVTPADNTTSQQLKSDADRMKAELATKSGAEYDRAYIANEVVYHQAVLNALDQTLIPGAQNAELKALLEKVRPAVAAHLQMAQQLQTKLGQ
jgi:putative membrane protein